MKPVIVMQMDFGMGGGSAMYGTIKKVDPELEVFDCKYSVEKFNVREASRSLNNMVAYWPAGTVFVSVVDPGVGTSRRASVAKLKNGSYVVTPDNGSLNDLVKTIGVDGIRVIDETRNRLKGTEKVSIFHGRDLFAYCAARLASGIIDFEGVGEEYPVSEIVMNEELECEVSEGKVTGYVSSMMKGFGNLESSISISAAEKAGLKVNEKVHVIIKHNEDVIVDNIIPYFASFGWVEIGEEVMYNSSDGVLGIGINQGSYIGKYSIETGKDWTISVSKEGR
ncbi:MAG: SAM-dependent chlorinase/fluorinase [Erysipelotrichaceae bacterium]|nr:SAM-dependent chlorinase/fluorinase [Erysipelotrichaceae bacterium]